MLMEYSKKTESLADLHPQQEVTTREIKNVRSVAIFHERSHFLDYSVDLHMFLKIYAFLK